MNCEAARGGEISFLWSSTILTPTPERVELQAPLFLKRIEAKINMVELMGEKYSVFDHVGTPADELVNFRQSRLRFYAELWKVNGA